MRGDTIAAIATAPGRGGVAVLRVSGPDAFDVARRVSGVSARSGLIKYAPFYADASERNRPIDHGLVLCFQAPRSYTGEDVVEFHCHGGSVTPRRVLEACFAAGARLARRGEFTERAFLNGKLSLEQAGAVIDLIDAKTSRAADAALEGLAGQRERAVRKIYDRLLALSAEVEHALDIDENELPEKFFLGAVEELSAIKRDLRAALADARAGKILREGALVVLAGAPNAGKSSLMNALLGENRAIVSDRAGTTRDSIEEWLDIDGWPVRLVDTAGLRATDDAIEAEGVKRSEELVAKAAVVVDLGGTGMEGVARDKTLRIWPKCDLVRGNGLNVSAKTGEGLIELRRAIADMLERQAASADEPPAPESCFAACHEALSVLEQADNPADLAVFGNLLRRSCEILGAEIGAFYTDDLLERVFSRFCVGK